MLRNPGIKLLIAFETRKVRELCENLAIAKSRLGNEIAEQLIHRIADIEAAENINDLLVGKPQIEGSEVRIDLGNDCGLLLSANHQNNPIDNGIVDWNKVSYVQVETISCQ